MKSQLLVSSGAGDLIGQLCSKQFELIQKSNEICGGKI